MEIDEKLKLIDECLEEPHSMNEKWLEMIEEYRAILAGNKNITISQFRRLAIQLGYEKVVRCKNCKYYNDSTHDSTCYCMRPIKSEDYEETGYMYPLEVPVAPYEFCSYGEKNGRGD